QEGASTAEGTQNLQSSESTVALTEYTADGGINITEETWDQVEAGGGDRVQATVTNNSDGNVFYKPESDRGNLAMSLRQHSECSAIRNKGERFPLLVRNKVVVLGEFSELKSGNLFKKKDQEITLTHLPNPYKNDKSQGTSFHVVIHRNRGHFSSPD
ncbi:MAG: hypothetical protein AAF804_13045, partial [Bacteroidota bacterium]